MIQKYRAYTAKIKAYQPLLVQAFMVLAPVVLKAVLECVLSKRSK